MTRSPELLKEKEKNFFCSFPMKTTEPGNENADFRYFDLFKESFFLSTPYK